MIPPRSQSPAAAAPHESQARAAAWPQLTTRGLESSLGFVVRELALKQLANKAASGNLPAMRLLLPWFQKALEKAAEEHQSALDKANRTVKELTDEELMAIILAEEKKSLKKRNPSNDGADGRKPGNLGSVLTLRCCFNDEYLGKQGSSGLVL